MSSIIKRRKTASYTQINNMPIQKDLDDLSAIGLLVFVMSLPENWELHKSHLHNHFTRRKVDSAWKILVEKNYIIGFYCHVNGKKRYYYNVSDIPFTQDDFNQFIIDIKNELESEDNTVYNINPIKDTILDIPDFLSIVQNEQFIRDNSNCATTKEILTKEILTNKHMLAIVNKDDLKKEIVNICNQYYNEFAVGRWSKKQWQVLINKFVNEILVKDKPPNNLEAYIYQSIKNMASNNQYKHSDGFKEYQDLMFKLNK